MSSAAIAAEYASLIYLSNVYDYCTVVAAVIVLYDHILTFSQEVNLLWNAKLRGGTLVFFFNRYVALAWSIYMILSVFPWSSIKSCEAVNIADQTLLLTLYVVWAAFSSLRVFATSGRNWIFTAVTATLALGPFAGDLALYAGTSYSIFTLPVLGDQCNVSFGLSYPQIAKVSIVIRSCLISSDVIVLATILCNTRQMFRSTRDGASLAALLRRDGLQYFIVLLCLNVLDMILFFTHVFENTTSSFIVPISSIVISRCLLNLREVAVAHGPSDESHMSSSLDFASNPEPSDSVQPSSQDTVHDRDAAHLIELSLLSSQLESEPLSPESDIEAARDLGKVTE